MEEAVGRSNNRLWDLAFQLVAAREARRKIIIEQQGEVKKFDLKEIHFFPQPRQGMWLNSNSEGQIWYFHLPAGSVAFITAIGLGAIRKGDYYFYKGAQKVDTPSSTRVYGSIESPTEFPLGVNLSYDDLIFKGRNDDDQKGYFEVLCRGIYIKREFVDEFFALLGRTGIEVVA